jgi:hypothetical protein
MIKKSASRKDAKALSFIKMKDKNFFFANFAALRANRIAFGQS